ncbi:MAG: transporter substrate-binding domain-containing protein [Desulfobulbus sp.]
MFATSATWPPMEFIDKDGRVSGYAIDYLTAAGKEAGFVAVFNRVPWEGIFVGLGRGKYDAIVSSVSITPARKRAMDFSIPYYAICQALVVPARSPATRLEHLAGRQVGCQDGTTGFFAVKRVPDVQVAFYATIDLAFADLRLGRISGVVCDDPVAAHYVAESGDVPLKIAVLLEGDDAVELYGVAVKKNQNREKLALINRGIAAVKAKGIDRKLREKWIPAPVCASDDPPSAPAAPSAPALPR